MRGIWTAIVTPFTEQGDLDLNAFKKLLKIQKESGVAGVIPGGTTGEAPTLTDDEKKTLILTAIQELKGTGVKVLAGTGTNCTRETLEFSRWADEQGVDGLLLVTPYYNKPSQQGIEAHFWTIAEEVSCEIMLYNVPGRTSVSLSPDTIVKLAAHPRITTLKEASGNVSTTSEILEALALNRKSLDILSGDDPTFLPLLSVGAVGIVSVASNIIPKVMVALQFAAEAGQYQRALEVHKQYYPLFRDLFIDSNPVPVKYAMSQMGLCSSHVRLPLLPLASAHREILTGTLKRCGLIQGRSNNE